MKKVLYIITKSNWGGAQRYVFDLATHMPEGFSVVVGFGPGAHSDRPGLLGELLAKKNLRTRLIPELGRDLGIADVAALKAIVQVLREEQPDVVHLNSSKAGFLGAIAARTAGVSRIIFTAHGWPFREERNLLWRAVAWLGSFATVLLSDLCICVCEADRSAFARFPSLGTKLKRIYNGIEMPLRLGTGEIIRRAFPTGARITGTIGELTANKDQAQLIAQAQHDPNMYVAIVGEGEDREKLGQMISAANLADRVKLFGYLPAHEVLKGFDRFALPSRKEGLPYVLIEARAAGLPIEANRTGGVGEVLDLPLETFALDTMVRETTALY
jgi:glycosyltransferase involved in cell wall biosynthesis